MSGAAPLLHGRQRRRREEHADRPAALRLARGLRGSARRSVKAASRNRSAGPIDFSLFTDGLKAEREQGITIDVAYRYFATARRKFILADTPGHEQYTRNMATGASTADLGDPARRRAPRRPRADAAARAHRAAARHLALRARRQQDGPGRLRRGVFDAIRADFAGPCRRREVHADSVERAARRQRHRPRSDRTPWFTGPPLLEYLETVDVDKRSPAAPSGSRCSSWCVPTTTSAATPGRSPRARSARATGSWCGRPAGRRASGASSPGTATWRGARADVGDVDARRRGRRQPRRRLSTTPLHASQPASRPTWCGWTSGRSIRAASTC